MGLFLIIVIFPRLLTSTRRRHFRPAENQEKFLAEERMITEAAPTMSAGVTGTGFSGTATATGPAAGFDPC